MNFTPKTWVTGDVITATELNRIEQGVEDAEVAIDALEVKSPVLTLSGDVTGSATFTNLGNATLTATVVDDSHNHVIANIDTLQSTLDGKVPTSRAVNAGTGLTGGGTLSADRTISHAAHTGDVTGATALTIANSAVTPAKTSFFSTQFGSTTALFIGEYDLQTSTAYITPSGWSYSKAATGVLDVTHTQNTTNVVVLPIADTNDIAVFQADTTSSSVIRITVNTTLDTENRKDVRFKFLCIFY